MARSHDTLRQQVEQAANYPIASNSGRERKLEVLEITSKQPKVINDVHPIVEILAQSIRPTTAVQMLDDSSQATVEDVREAAVQATNAALREQPVLFADQEIIQRLCTIHSDAQPEIRGLIFKIFRKIAEDIDQHLIDETILPTIQVEIEFSEYGQSGAEEALKTVGMWIGKEIGRQEELLEIIFEVADESSSDAGKLAAEAVGLALNNLDAPTGELHEVWHRLYEREDPVVAEGITRGAMVAINHDEEGILRICDLIFEKLQTHDNPDIREVVPQVVASTIADISEDLAEVQYGFLETAFEDESEAVQARAVDAAATAVANRDDTIEPFVELLEEAVLEKEGTPSTVAVDALGNQSVIKQIASTTNKKEDEFTQALESRVIDSNNKGGSEPAISSINHLSGADFDRIREQSQEDDGSVPNQLNREKLEEAGKGLLEEQSIDRVPLYYEESHSIKAKLTIIEAIKHCFTEWEGPNRRWESHFEILAKAWNNASQPVKLEALEAISVGVFEDCLPWGGCSWVFDEAQNKDEDQLRAKSLSIITDFLDQNYVAWSDVDNWIKDATSDPNLTVRSNAIGCIGIATGKGAVSWSTTTEFLEEAQESGSPTMEKAVPLAILNIARNGDIDWGQVYPWLDEAFENGSTDTAQNAVKAVGAGLSHEVFEWTEVVHFLDRAIKSDVEPIVSEAVRAACQPLGNETKPWEELEDYIIGPKPDAVEVVENSINGVIIGLSQEGLSWNRIDGYLEECLKSETGKIATKALEGIRVGLEKNQVRWDEAEPLLFTALEHDSDAVAKAAVESIGPGISEVHIGWAECDEFLWTAFRNRESAITPSHLQILQVGITNDFSWKDIESYIETASESNQTETATRAIETAGIALKVGAVKWEQIQDTLFIAREDNRDEVTTEAIRAVVEGIKGERVSRSTGVRFITTTFEERSDSGRIGALQGIIRLWAEGYLDGRIAINILNRSIQEGDSDEVELAISSIEKTLALGDAEFSEIQAPLERAMATRDDYLANQAVRSVEEGVKTGVIDWGTVTPFLKDALSMDSIAVAEGAVEVIEQMVLSNEVTWEEIAPLLEIAISDSRINIVEEGLKAVQAAVKFISVPQKDLRDIVEEVYSRHETGGGMPVQEWCNLVERGIRDNTIEWDSVFEYIKKLIERNHFESSGQALITAGKLTKDGPVNWNDVQGLYVIAAHSDEERLKSIAANHLKVFILNDYISFSEIDGLLPELLDSQRLDSRKSAIACAGAALQNDAGNWEEIAPIIEEAAGDPELEDEVIRASGSAYIHDIADWSEVEHHFKRVINQGNTEAIEEIPSSVHVKGHSLEWDTVEQVLRDVRDEGTEEAAIDVMRTVPAIIADTDVQWSDVEEFYIESRDESAERIATNAIGRLSHCLKNGAIEWDTISRFMHDTVQSADPEIARYAIYASRTSLDHPDVDFKQLVSFFETALSREEEDVRRTALAGLFKSTSNEQVEWTDIEPLLRMAINNGSPDTQGHAVQVVGVGVEHEVFEIHEAIDILVDVRNEASKRATEEAIRAVSVGVIFQDIQKERFESYIDPLLPVQDEAIGRGLIRSESQFLDSGEISPESYANRILEIYEEIPTLVEDIVESIQDSLYNDLADLDDVEQVLLNVLDNTGPEMRLAAMRAFTPLTMNKSSPLQPKSVVKKGIKDSNSGIRNFSIELLHVALDVHNPDEETLLDLIYVATNDPDPTIAKRGIGLFSKAIHNGYSPDDRFNEQLRSILEDPDEDSEKVRNSIGAAVTHWDELGFSNEDVSLIANGLDTDDEDTLLMALEGIGKVLQDVDPSQIEHHESIIRQIWGYLEAESAQVQYQAAVTLAQIHMQYPLSVPKGQAENLREALAITTHSQFQFDSRHRVQLIDLLVQADPNPVKKGLIGQD